MTEKAKILVVDDTKQFRVEIKNFLEGRYDISEASDGLIALNQVKEEKPDLIILDLEMPVMDGLEFLDKCGEIFEALPPVLILTTVSTKRKETRKGGAQFYMSKPVQKDRLLNVIEILLKTEPTTPEIE